MKKSYLFKNLNVLQAKKIETPIRIFLVFTLLVFSCLTFAQTAGPNQALTGANLTGVGAFAWTTTGSISTADAVYATSTFSAAGNSNYLKATNYNFSIPNGVVIKGIELTINRKTSATNGGRITRDNVVSLLKNGVITGNNKATAAAWPLTAASVTYGSSTDLWGTTWTSADFNNVNFGAVLSANANNSLITSVDYMQITVYYTPAPTISGFSVTSACTGTTPTLLINGNYFTGVSAVSFNGTAASFTYINVNQVSATLPSGATTGPISVTTPSGTVISASNFTVNPLPVLSAISGTTSVCIGSNTTLSNTTPGGTWGSATPSVATINTAGVISPVSAGTSLITYTYTNGNGCTNSVNTTVTVNALPVVSAPASVCAGSTTQLSPSTGGIWTSSDSTKATVDNTGLVTAVAAGSVSFTYTDTATNCSKTTSPVSIFTAPSITANPLSSQTVCSGSSASFTVSASGNGLTYQWYNGATPLNNGGNISGATSATLTINPVSLANAGTTYNCIVSGTCSPAANSQNSELIVVEKVAIISQPVTSQTFCTGESATMNITATGSGISYQWYKGATPLSDGGSVTGSNTDTLTISPLVASDAASNYYCLVSGTSPCSAVASNNSQLVINQAASIFAQPEASQTSCENGVVAISVAAAGGSLTYQWYKGATPLSNGGNISGATSATLLVNPVSLADAGTNYYCVVTNSCATGITSDYAAIIIAPKAVIPAQSATTCSQSAFSVNPVNGIPDSGTIVPANTTYSWAAPIVTGGMTGGVAQTGQISIFGTLTNTTNSNQTATYTVTPASGTTPSCTGNSFTVTITVEPKPVVAAINATICTGNTYSLTPTNGGANIIPVGTVYSWSSPVVTGGLTGGTAGTNQAAIIQTLTNPTVVAQTATYTVTPISGNCTGAAFTLTITVNPKPVTSVSLSTQTGCSGLVFSTINIANTNNLATTYNWTRDNTTNVTGIISGTSGLIAAGSPFAFAQILTNNTTTTQTVTYTFTPVANGCPGDPITAVVNVNVATVGGTVSSSMPNVTPIIRTVTECHFATGNLYLSGHTGNIIRWESSTDGGTTWTNIANTTTTHTYTNITQSTFFRALIQNGTACTQVYSYVALVDVIPNVKPTPVTATPQTICVGDSSVLYSESGYATSSYLANGGTFSNANPINWLVDGCGNCLSASGSNTSDGPFRLSATNGGTYAGTNYTATGKFAIASGNYNSIMQTPIFNTFGLPSATLKFNHAYNLQAGAAAIVQLSTDGGATYPVTLASWFGAGTRTPYTAFPLTSIDLSSYIGQANLRVRFVYTGTVNSSWAIDNILIPETPSNLTTVWVDSITGQVISTAATLTVTPTVTTTYAITSYLNGCTSYGPEGTTYITVTVNPRPTANIGAAQTICYGGTATFSVALTGNAPWSLTYSNGTTSTTVNNITTNPYVFSVNNITSNQTYTISGLSDTKCTALPQDLTGSAPVTVLNGTPGLWTGLVSTDWFDCKNWAGGLPSATINAQIPAGAARMPLIDPATSSFASLYGNIARAQDVIIAGTATLTMATNSNLYVSRDWKNSGTFTPGQGTVTFNGATASQIQTINAGIQTKENFYNLTLNNSNGATGISVVDGFELTVTNNLSLLSGDLRLTGEAQIVQNGTVSNPSAGTGKILVDQQGHKSSHIYNFWCSLVTSDGTNTTIASVLRDGTNSTASPFNPGTINFGNGAYFADGALTSPIKISNRWLYKYTAVSTSYADWQLIGSTGSLNRGDGFTMKGPTGIAPFTTPQNYVFTGKPNNGTIGINIALNQSYLMGNPYPSALDADEFIKDNIHDAGGRAATNIFNGALYFWDHFGGESHILGEYIGGYATYTLIGGVVAVSNDPLVNANGQQGTKVPKRYIPVAQGFFIGLDANTPLTTNNPNLNPITGGTIQFKNSQRVFKAKSTANSVFFRSQQTAANDTIDVRQKIRLLFESPNHLYRQLLVGADENATNLFDIGYDAPMIERNTEDMYWNIGQGKFTIQAVADFNETQILPIGIKTAAEGISSIWVANLENIPESMQLFIYDNVTGNYYDIKNGQFSIALPIGEYTERFSLRFSSTTLGTNAVQAANDPVIYYSNKDNQLNIKNTNLKDKIKTVTLYNLLGQFIKTYDISSDREIVQVPMQNLASGTYVVKAVTENNNNFSEKIIKK